MRNKLYWKAFGKIVFYALILAAAAQLIVLQAIPAHGDDLYSEGSLTEWIQIHLVAISIFVFMWAGVKYRVSRPFNAAMIGFLLMVATRESDATFDALFDGAWQVTVFFTFIITVLMVIRAKGLFWSELEDFMKLPAYGFFMAGALVVFVFSRLYGQKHLWQLVMHDKFMYSVKAAAEENTEIIGYCLILIAAMEWLSRCREMGEKKKDGGLPL